MCNVIRPAPVQRKIIVAGPDVCSLVCLQENVFHFQLAGFFLPHACAQNHFYIRRMLVHYLAHHYKKVGNFLVGCTFGIAEPGSGAFMIYTQKNPSVRAKVLGKQNNVFFLKMRINCNCKDNIHTMAADFFHKTEWFAIEQTFAATPVRKIIFVRRIPHVLGIPGLLQFAGTNRPFLVVGIICIHKANASVNFVQLVENIILIYIKGAFTSVTQIKSAISRF